MTLKLPKYLLILWRDRIVVIMDTFGTPDISELSLFITYF
jgi:hypothetical protein